MIDRQSRWSDKSNEVGAVPIATHLFVWTTSQFDQITKQQRVFTESNLIFFSVWKQLKSAGEIVTSIKKNAEIFVKTQNQALIRRFEKIKTINFQLKIIINFLKYI